MKATDYFKEFFGRTHNMEVGGVDAIRFAESFAEHKYSELLKQNKELAEVVNSLHEDKIKWINQKNANTKT